MCKLMEDFGEKIRGVFSFKKEKKKESDFFDEIKKLIEENSI